MTIAIYGLKITFLPEAGLGNTGTPLFSLEVTCEVFPDSRICHGLKCFGPELLSLVRKPG
jgi:hypothetical protein